MSDETNKLDAPKRDAREWLESKGWGDLSLYWPTNKPIPQIDYESGEAKPTIDDILEAYALPFIKERDAAQCRLVEISALIGNDEFVEHEWKHDKNPTKRVVAALQSGADFAERAEKAESERDALRGALKKIIGRYDVISDWDGDIKCRDLKDEMGEEVEAARAALEVKP
jgi:hypothetical protein